MKNLIKKLSEIKESTDIGKIGVYFVYFLSFIFLAVALMTCFSLLFAIITGRIDASGF
ncbi:hypothetical protein Phi18:2_gp05 [Cellulophaga phage phi18:2]|uniref:Uncharacterized protein n=2 Tax=Cellulophaga phage phi18:1 TaxID=1327982 RepID=S0A4K1_9CAUD|nr:hypothetical protein Phi18:1_gp05 [Cellulophaga phage phi18:1]AGO48452.1 hypothetical protein Phi18:1_gp05 [Cellulophaga phage phi18:1]AGO49168.1 hypothetical protein Phi18:2_gp05 [Cellulophaga phage phi18:2]